MRTMATSWFLTTLRATLFGEGFEESLQKLFFAAWKRMPSREERRHRDGIVVLEGESPDNRWKLIAQSQLGRLDLIKMAEVPPVAATGSFSRLSPTNAVLTDFMERVHRAVSAIDGPVFRVAVGVVGQVQCRDRQSANRYIADRFSGFPLQDDEPV